MRRLEPCDVVMVGLGATGGIAVGPLTEAGLTVVALEAGGRHDGGTRYVADEIANDVRNQWGMGKTNLEVPTLRGSEADTAAPPFARMPMINVVGGSALHSSSVYYRLFPFHFRERTETIERYGKDHLPEGSSVQDWPFGYDELEPYYTKVEELLGVSGKAGNLNGEIDPAGNVFEGPRSKEYPLPPLRRTGFAKLMDTAASDLGWHPYAGAAAIRSQPYKGLNECTYCGFCSFGDCWRGAKGLTSLSGIPEAEASGNLDVRTGARVVSIETRADGRATGVTYVKDGEEHFQPAAAVILGTFTYENVRLMMLSKNEHHPGGIGNGRDQLGRNLHLHNLVIVRGLFEGHEMNSNGGTSSQTSTIDDWDGDNFDHGGLGFIGGSTMTASVETKPISLARVVPAHVPRWGSEWKSFLKRNGRSIGELILQIEQIPYTEHRVDLDPTHVDPTGMPVNRTTTRHRESDYKAFQFLTEKAQAWLRAAGATETWVPEMYGMLSVQPHCYGATRMGEDPGESVVDEAARVHDAPNVAVLGSCTMPTAGGRNPTLTAQALAWRTAERLVADWDTVAA
jgi:gluconate 2-dehydrogenase alpha chain